MRFAKISGGRALRVEFPGLNRPMPTRNAGENEKYSHEPARRKAWAGLIQARLAPICQMIDFFKHVANEDGVLAVEDGALQQPGLLAKHGIAV